LASSNPLSTLLQRFACARLGARAEVIDNLAAEEDQLLAVAAALHISSGRVKIGADALAKTEHHPLGILDATAGDEDDPLRAAALVGVVARLVSHRPAGGLAVPRRRSDAADVDAAVQSCRSCRRRHGRDQEAGDAAAGFAPRRMRST
jgi:hypothetical protein